MAIKLKIEGFEKLLKDIEAAGGTINKACDSALKQSAQIMHEELKTQMQAAGADAGLIAEMSPPKVENEGNEFWARVGYKKGSYDPKNPSAGYKAVFLNYGTPRRSKHGIESPRDFITSAKKKAMPKIKKAQKAALEKILSRLGK